MHQIALFNWFKSSRPDQLLRRHRRSHGLTQGATAKGALEAYGEAAIETVSHGTSWSIYLRDPEGNRLELFVDTPWHVDQPLRFPIDLSLTDDELIAWTEKRISALAGFQPARGWFRKLAAGLGEAVD